MEYRYRRIQCHGLEYSSIYHHRSIVVYRTLMETNPDGSGMNATDQSAARQKRD